MGTCASGVLTFHSNARNGAAGKQLDSREAQAQIEASRQQQESLAGTAQKHNARLKGEEGADEAAPEKLPAMLHMAKTEELIKAETAGGGDGGSGGDGSATAYSGPLLQLSAPSGIAVATPASAMLTAGSSISLTAGQDINLASQENLFNAVATGISLFTYGKATNADKPNKEMGIALHAASGKVSSQSQGGETRITADKAITVASVTKAIGITASKHVLMTAQGAFIKLEGGNIMIHGPGKMEFKASKKELAGPQNGTSKLTTPPKGDLKGCATFTQGPAALGQAAVELG